VSQLTDDELYAVREQVINTLVQHGFNVIVLTFKVGGRRIGFSSNMPRDMLIGALTEAVKHSESLAAEGKVQ